MPSLTTTSHVRVSVLDEVLTRPLLQAGFWPDGVTVVPTRAKSVDANSRAMLDLSFDVAEMSLATYLRARIVDGLSLIALPVFTGRRFTQPLMGIGAAADVHEPADLRGRRVALPQFGMTSSMWHRQVLRSYYGLDHTEIEWITTDPERTSGTAQDGSFTRIDDGRSPVALVQDGVADAALMARPPRELTPLFDDLVSEQQKYFGATGILPVMHLVVLREQIVHDRPDLVPLIVQSFARARAAAMPGPELASFPDSAARGVILDDPWAHGLDAAVPSITALIDQAVHEHAIPTAVPATDLFLKGTP